MIPTKLKLTFLINGELTDFVHQSIYLPSIPAPKTFLVFGDIDNRFMFRCDEVSYFTESKELEIFYSTDIMLKRQAATDYVDKLISAGFTKSV